MRLLTEKEGWTGICRHGPNVRGNIDVESRIYKCTNKVLPVMRSLDKQIIITFSFSKRRAEGKCPKSRKER